MFRIGNNSNEINPQKNEPYTSLLSTGWVIMKIIIDYESSWQNFIFDRFEWSKTCQKEEFKASSKSKEAEDVKPISHNTILGVLSRLIGDQRKLYQAKIVKNFILKIWIFLLQKTKKSRKMDWESVLN